MAEITPALIKDLREKTGAGFAQCKEALTEASGDIDEAIKVLRKKGLAAAGKKAGRITSEGLVAVEVSGNKGVMVEVNSETDFVAQNAEFKALVKEIAQLVLQSNAADAESIVSEKWPNDAEGRKVSEVLATHIARIGENISIRRFVRYETDGVLGSYVHGNGRIGVLVDVKGSDNKEVAGGVAKDVAMHVAAAEPRFLKRDEVTEKDLDTEREIAKDQALKSGKPENVVDKIVSGKMEKFYGESVLLEQPFIKDDKMTITQLLTQKGKEAGGTLEVARFTRFKLGEGLQKREDNFAAEVAAQAGL